ncbi:MAG: TolC family protein [Candidatus Omnitrophica bacterium]|nr:TolC family protein [Candidatus Omnitrophota bacterium]
MVKKASILILITIFILNFGLLYSQEKALVLSLKELMAEARKNNPDIQAAKARWQASLARVPQAKALESPSVGISSDRMLSIQQVFPLFGKLSLKGKVAFIESQMFAAEYKNKELEVIEELKHAYHDLFMNYKEAELDQESLSILDAVANIVEAKYIVGEASQEQFFKIILEMAKLSNDIQNLTQVKRAIETRINLLLNRDARLFLGVPQLEEAVNFDKDVDYLYKLTLENQPELSTFALAIEKNKFAESLAKRNIFPDIMSEIVLRSITSGGIGPWDVALSFTLPFWFWTKQRYEVKEAIANLDEAKAVYQSMKNRAFIQTQDLVVKVGISKNRISLYKNNQIPLLESSIESSLSAIRSGKGDFMSLLDTLRMVLETKMSYYRALVDYHMSLTDLEFSTGVDLMNIKEVNK